MPRARPLAIPALRHRPAVPGALPSGLNSELTPIEGLSPQLGRRIRCDPAQQQPSPGALSERNLPSLAHFARLSALVARMSTRSGAFMLVLVHFQRQPSWPVSPRSSLPTAKVSSWVSSHRCATPEPSLCPTGSCYTRLVSPMVCGYRLALPVLHRLASITTLD